MSKYVVTFIGHDEKVTKDTFDVQGLSISYEGQFLVVHERGYEKRVIASYPVSVKPILELFEEK